MLSVVARFVLPCPGVKASSSRLTLRASADASPTIHVGLSFMSRMLKPSPGGHCSILRSARSRAFSNQVRPSRVLLLRRPEETHRRPRDDLEAPPIEQMNDDRHRDRRRSHGKRRFPEPEESKEHERVPLTRWLATLRRSVGPWATKDASSK